MLLLNLVISGSILWLPPNRRSQEEVESLNQWQYFGILSPNEEAEGTLNAELSHRFVQQGEGQRSAPWEKQLHAPTRTAWQPPS